MHECEKTYRAHNEHEGEGQQCPSTTDSGREGGRAQSTEECTCLQNGDDIGADLVRFVLVDDAVYVGDAKVSLEIRLCDYTTTNTTTAMLVGEESERS